MRRADCAVALSVTPDPDRMMACGTACAFSGKLESDTVARGVGDEDASAPCTDDVAPMVFILGSVLLRAPAKFP